MAVGALTSQLNNNAPAIDRNTRMLDRLMRTGNDINTNAKRDRRLLNELVQHIHGRNAGSSVAAPLDENKVRVAHAI